MPQLDQDPIDPEITATLDAIDATLAGEPVDGRYAEIAEIALLLASDKPQVPPAFATSLDGKVEQRFAPLGGKKRSFGSRTPRDRRRSLRVWEATGAIAAGLAAVLAIVVVAGGGLHGGSSVSSSSSAASSATPPSTMTRAATSAGSASSSAGAAASTPSTHSAPSRAAKSQSALVPPTNSAPGSSASGSFAPGSAASSASAPTVQPPTTGRKVVQGAQLNLTAASNRIDDVAQEIYNVVGQANGIVENSSVTQGGPGGAANFELSLPSGGLAQTMSQLSSLNYAQVVSRTDSSQDITDQYGAATRALADARALRTSLLKQLANATTTDQVNSLNAQIHDAEASISSDQATLNRLNHSVNFSQVYVTIQSKPVTGPVSHGGGGFTLGRAAHDAGRVLTVAAGVALIAIAALTPVALVVALAWWVASALKRRRREQALDSV
jgi:Domain of unknown function (DUF4349)